MAMMLCTVLTVIAAGSIVAAVDSNTSADAPVDPKGSTAVGKIVTLLTDTRDQAAEELYQEEKTYTKFVHFCDDTKEEKNDAIAKGKQSEENLEAKLVSEAAKIVARTQDISDANKAIEGLKEDIAKLVEARAETKATYATNKQDMDTAIEALDNAVRSVQNSKEPLSLLQLPEVKKATALANFLGLGSQAAEKLLFHEEAAQEVVQTSKDDKDWREIGSTGSAVQETLEKFRDELRDKRNEADLAEMKSKATFSNEKQAKDIEVAQQEKILEDNTALKGTAEAEKANAEQDLALTVKNLKDDNDYLSETTKLCADKKAAWTQRKATREGEIEAIDKAIGIMEEGMEVNKSYKDSGLLETSSSVETAARPISDHKDALLLAEVAAEEAEAPTRNLRAGFLQLHSMESQRKAPSGTSLSQQIASMLRSKSIELKSPALLAVSREAAAVKGEDPLAKIKDLLGTVISDLEAKNEDKLVQCEENTAAEKEKRDTAFAAVKKANTAMASAEAKRDMLAENIRLTEKQLAELKANKDKAQEIRDQEKAENAHAVQEATQGVAAVTSAIEVLKTFYDSAAKKTAVEHSADVGKETSIKKDAPDAGFDSSKAYHGKGQNAAIFGMLEVIKSDFDQTLTETKADEEQAAQEHEEFLDENTASKEEKEAAKKEMETDKTTEETTHIKEEGELKAESKALKNALEQLAILDKMCRVQDQAQKRLDARKAEMDALTEAIDYLDKMFPNLSSAQ
mmetsp:Transcript_27689/g.50009  ORF Transcript_27689/g.50009 Transcript_27689/m.50009 type:complete len:742 (+) Transcript_27689:77-2302(+)|eukprot:CAMPEP_0197623308 /NCGR_PEP_ID=MMETSP1338-20131121/3346_1 /TAXON_ID=43686 ORGANISM="Pelagodinium beii, Strain RCC1491" /NCGR_SAMPLE_ID=MMETSP1338 /ASSEMBLY_ACC=CAM_ASM_000754 /LENGTH=741 /DNA_ID=CAMNT_0043193239 /DNA_START=68 /DNA_END=2293 /DNA_ORIENTATION=+